MSDLIEDPQDDIRADIQAALDGHQEPAPLPADTIPAPEPEAPQPDKDGPARDEQGKFAKAPEPAQDSTTQPTPAAEPQVETIRPPASWSATAKAQFAALDPIVQQEVLKREKDIESGKAQWDAKGERLNKFEALIAPRKDRLALAGVDEFTAIQQLLAAHDYLERDPAAAIQYLAQQYGADLTSLGAGPQAQTLNLPQDNPAVATLQQKIDALEQRLQSDTQAKEDEAKAQAASEWKAFREDPKFPYAENVKEDMALLLGNGRAATLSEAYERAVWANPETRALMQNQVAKPEPPKDTRKAGLGVTGAPGLGQRPAAQGDPEASVEDDVRAAWLAASGHV